MGGRVSRAGSGELREGSARSFGGEFWLGVVVRESCHRECRGGGGCSSGEFVSGRGVSGTV